MPGSTSNKVVHTWFTQKQSDTWLTQKQNDTTIHTWLTHEGILLKYTLNSHWTARLAATLALLQVLRALDYQEVKDNFNNNVDIPSSLATQKY